MCLKFVPNTLIEIVSSVFRTQNYIHWDLQTSSRHVFLSVTKHGEIYHTKRLLFGRDEKKRKDDL